MKTFEEFLNESIDEMSNMKINKAYAKIRNKYSDTRDDKYKNITKNSGHVFYKDEDYEVRILSQNMLEHIVSIIIAERKTKTYRTITCEKYKIGFFNVSLKGFSDIKPLEFIANLKDEILNKIIENINIALKIKITYDKFIKAIEKASKKYEKFNESENIDEGLLGDYTVKKTKSIISIFFGDAWVDDEILTVTDAADEIVFTDGKMMLYFMEQQNAIKTFKKLANMFGCDTKRNSFVGGAGVCCNIQNINDNINNTSTNTHTQIASNSVFKSPIQLVREGYEKINASEALSLMNGNMITKYAFSLKFRKDTNGIQSWFKGPNIEVFNTFKDALLKYNQNTFTITTENVFNIHDEKFKEVKKNGGEFFFVKNGEKRISNWTLAFAIKKINFVTF